MGTIGLFNAKVKMEDLIPVVNKLQDILGRCPSLSRRIDLPQIVVVGSQSAGKSSVLESIVGRDFLPRGTGIVTRRPLVLQLIKDSQEFAVFLDQPDRVFTDFEEVRNEIQEATKRVVGSGKGISDEPINLKIFSPKVLNITLVDLPGLVVNALPDQPADIGKQVRRMVKSYISQANALILAITPANIDIATSEALNIAKEVDPDMERTLGVITKLDLMDRGTNAEDVLKGRTLPLALGYVGLVCRGQQAINENQSFEEHLRTEEEFFSSHPDYGEYGAEQGTPFLSKRLNQVLLEHISRRLPEVSRAIEAALNNRRRELELLGVQISEENRLSEMITQVDDFVRGMKKQLKNGRYDSNSEEKISVRINKILNVELAKKLQALKVLDSISQAQLITAITNANGYSGNMFIPETLFEEILSQVIPKLAPVCLRAVEEVATVLRRTAPKDGRLSMVYHGLFVKLSEALNRLIERKLEEAKQLVSSFIEIECSYIRIHNPDFVHGYTVMSLLMPQVKEESKYQYQRVDGVQPADLNKVMTKLNEEKFKNLFEMFKTPQTKSDFISKLIQRLTGQYLAIVIRMLANYVPKACITLLVKETKAELKKECLLVTEATIASSAAELMQEDLHVQLKRKVCKEQIEVLTEASNWLNYEFRDF
jgi:GTPase SAR1 family protein